MAIKTNKYTEIAQKCEVMWVQILTNFRRLGGYLCLSMNGDADWKQLPGSIWYVD